ncbi:hypothetical protein [Cohnella soli]|uniref:YtkA-like domain-containing protein n=1 Tax=Cohnella soli TaxID=425005 RepID=A0ABW0HXG4_9BACL
MRKLLFAGMAFVLSATLLAGCGKKADHEAMGQDSMASESAGGHGGHGAMDGKESGETEAATTAAWKWEETGLKPGADVKLSIAIQDKNGAAVEAFKLNHEKKMHLIVVSNDLSFFNHIHPEYKGDGQFEVTTKFPAAGTYKMFADYIPEGGSATTRSERLTVKGEEPATNAIKPDTELVKETEGVKVELALNGAVVGKEIKLNFHITDEKSGDPVTDLQPVLGAVGHVVILDSNAEHYLHVHPVVEDAKGPDAEFMTTFPVAGVYKIWGQFKRGGKDFIVPFVVQVK